MIMKRPRRALWLAAVAALGCAAAVSAKPAAPPLQWKGMPLNRATTFITGPRYADGSVDYIAALNTLMGKGVTAKNNAAIGLIRAFGDAPHVLGKHWRKELGALRIAKKGMLGGRLTSVHAWCVKHQIHYPSRPGRFNWTGRPWSAAQHPLRARYIKSMTKYLHEVRKAVELPRYFVPLIAPKEPSQLIKVWLGPLAATRTAAGALAAQAMLELHEGHLRAVRRNIMAIYRLGALVSQQPVIISYIVGVSIGQGASRAQVALARTICQHAPVHPLRLRVVPPRSRPLWFSISVGERFYALDGAFWFYKTIARMPNLSPQAQLKQKAWLFQQINIDFARQSRIAMIPNYAQAHTRADALKNRLITRAKKAFPKPNAGELFYRSDILTSQAMIPATLRLKFQALAARRLARIALALATFHARHKSFPNKLKQLQGKYLTAVPLDPFTGKAFIYHGTPRGCVLASAGPGGEHKHPNRWKQGRGLLVRLPN